MKSNIKNAIDTLRKIAPNISEMDQVFTIADEAEQEFCDTINTLILSNRAIISAHKSILELLKDAGDTESVKVVKGRCESIIYSSERTIEDFEELLTTLEGEVI